MMIATTTQLSVRPAVASSSGGFLTVRSLDAASCAPAGSASLAPPSHRKAEPAPGRPQLDRHHPFASIR